MLCGGDLVYARVTSYRGGGVYQLSIFGNGLTEPATETATAVVTSLCSHLYTDSVIPNNTIVLVKKQVYKVVV